MEGTRLTPNSSSHDLGSSLSSLSGNEESSIYGQPNPFRVKAKGQGLASGHTNQPCFFTLDARKAGYGDFDILIKGPSQADIIYHDQDDDTLYTVEFRVSLPGDYSIEIRYDNKHIPGSPFASKITSLNDKSTGKPIRETTEAVENGPKVLLNGGAYSSDEKSKTTPKKKVNGAVASFQGYVTSPSGDILNASLVRKNDGTFAVQFQKSEVGTYLVNIVNPNTGKCISGCPFKVKVEELTEEEPKVYGSGLEYCEVGKTGMFTVKGNQNFSFSDLAVAFEGDGLSSIKVFKNFYDSAEFLYVPNKAGKFKVHINYHGLRITGSPFRLTVKNRKRCKEIYGNSEPGSVFLLAWVGKELGKKVNTFVLKPSNDRLPHSFSNRGNNLYEIRFCPDENGTHVVRIGDDAVDSEPVEFVINTQTTPTIQEQTFAAMNAASVLDTKVGQPGKVVVDLPMGIPRYLTIQFSGPSQVDSQRVEGSNGQIVVHYKARLPGNYLVSVIYDGIPIQGSPYQILVLDESGNAMLDSGNSVEYCSCYGKGLQEAKAGEISNFTVDARNAGAGSLMVGFDDPDVIATEVVSKQMGNCVYDVQYCIEKRGWYELTVMWGGKHVPGSPFRVHVT